jgi:hypothetical protein
VCYTYGHTTSNEFGAFPGYSEDLFVREDAEVVEQRVKPVRMVINGKAYAHNPLNNELYNYEEYKKSGRVILEGNLKMVDGNKIELKKIENRLNYKNNIKNKIDKFECEFNR